MEDKLRLKIKHWVAATPSPRDGRAALLLAAAGVRKVHSLEVAWFGTTSLRFPTNQYDALFPWAVANGFQSRSAVCI